MPQPRVISPDLSGPVNLQQSQVAPDTFSRPRADAGAGSALADLSQALGRLRPDIAAFSQPIMQDYVDTEVASGQRYREQMKAGAVNAGDFAKERKGWSIYRNQGYEMADAQITASDYLQELRDSLTRLATDENASPQAAAQVLADTRAKFLAKGEGSGAIWQKTFEQYRQSYETGAMSNFREQLDAERERVAVSKVTQHYAEELYSLAGSNDPTAAVKLWQKMYADPSFLQSPLSPTQQVQAMANGFRIANLKAISDGRFDHADAIMAMMRTAETRDGSLVSTTLMGSQALDEMARDLHYAKINANETDQDKRRANIEQLNVDLRSFIKGQSGSPDKWAPALPSDLLDRAAKFGLDQEFAQKYNYFRFQPSAEAKKEDAQTLSSAKGKVMDLMLSWQSNQTEANLSAVTKSFHDLTSDPDFSGPEAKAMLVNALDRMDSFKEGFSDTGKVRSPAVATGARAFDQDMRYEFSALDKAVRAVTTAQPDLLGSLQKRLGITEVPADDGTSQFVKNDLRANMIQAYQDGVDKLRQGRPWSEVSLKELDGVRKDVLDRFRPRIQELVKQAQDAAKEPVPDAGPGAPVSELPKLGSDGVPTQALVRSVMNARWTQDDYASGGARASLFATGGLKLLYDKFRGSDAGWITKRATDLDIPANFLRYPVASVAGSMAFDNQWRITNENLRRAEATNGELLKKVATDGLPGGMLTNMSLTNGLSGTAAERNAVLQWARLRADWQTMANLRGLSVDELAKTPKSWVVEDNTPFPTVPVFLATQEMTDENLGKIKSLYGLNDAQLKAFAATQLKLLETRNAHRTHDVFNVDQPVSFGSASPSEHEPVGSGRQ
jgi:hypothetical protein